LQLNSDLPAIAELLEVRALRKLIESFGDSLLAAVNPVTGRFRQELADAQLTWGMFIEQFQYKARSL
jgi:DNA polymerase I-like protein with 3'-5' exonuclease and polymerase domains